MRAIDDKKRTLILETILSGATVPQAARKHAVSESTITRILREHRAQGGKAGRGRGRPRKRLLWHPTPSGHHSFEIVPTTTAVVEEMCVKYHGYGSAGAICTYAFAVIEDGTPVAAFAWQPPAPGAAKSACPEAPETVLSLSRMVAVPKGERRLRHISKPLRYQMLRLIDRTRWPVLVTFSDESQGHTGHVYKCSGWHPTMRSQRTFFLDENNRRASFVTSDRKKKERGLRQGGVAFLQRWEHWICERDEVATWLTDHGWERVPIPGRHWRSGAPAFRWVLQKH